MPITERLAAEQSRWRRWGFIAASLIVHAGLLVAVVAGTSEGEATAAEPEEEEEITFVDISRVAPPPPPAASATAQQPEPQREQPTPRTQQPDPRPRQRPEPRTPPRAADIIDPVDSLPQQPLGRDIPPAPTPRVGSSVSSPVTGTATGGVAGGVEGGVTGGKVGGVVGGQGEEVPDPGGTFIAAVVDRQAELSNRNALPRLMRRLYPDILRDAGIGARVIVQFVVDTNGRVDMSTLKIVSSSHEGFEDPTRMAIREFRFTPARMGDRTVRMLTQLPIVWEVQK